MWVAILILYKSTPRIPTTNLLDFGIIHFHPLSSSSSFCFCPLFGGRVVIGVIIFFDIDKKDDEEGNDTKSRPIETTFPSA